MQSYIIPKQFIIPNQAFNKYRDEADRLGNGTYGKVFRARWRDIDVAVKIFDLKSLPNHLYSELKIYCETNYLHLVRFYGVCLDPGKFAMITELLYCTLAAFMTDHGSIPAALKECIKKDVNKAVNYLHEEGYAHKHIKPTNILLDEHLRTKLGRFGLSKIKIESCSSGHTTASSSVRWRPHTSFTREYARKKNENEELVIHQKTDIYALGVLGWYLQKEEHPFADLTESGVVRELYNPQGRRLEIDPTWPSDIKNQMIACLDECEQNRPSALELLTAQKKKEIKQVYMAFMATKGGNQLFSQPGMRDVIPIIASFLYRL